jgi:hypothetical protein
MRSPDWNIPPVVRIFLCLDIILCLTFVTNYLLGQPFSKPTALLDLNGENSLPAWYSSMQFFFIFLLAAIFVHHRFRLQGRHLSLVGLPALFLLMSIDESVMIHEYLGRRSDVLLAGGSRDGTMFQETGIWALVIGIPFLILFFLWLRSVKRYIAMPSAVSKLAIGIGIMLGGALGCEFLSNFLGESLRIAELVCEEGFEMIGATVMLWAVYDMAEEYLPDPHAIPEVPPVMAPTPALAGIATCAATALCLETSPLTAEGNLAVEEAPASSDSYGT